MPGWYVRLEAGHLAAERRRTGDLPPDYSLTSADAAELGKSQRPGHQLQADVKFIEPLGQTGRRKKYYQFTAIDDCTRLRVLRAYPRCDRWTAHAGQYYAKSSRSRILWASA
jgi:hypothetical protein